MSILPISYSEAYINSSFSSYKASQEVLSAEDTSTAAPGLEENNSDEYIDDSILVSTNAIDMYNNEKNTGQSDTTKIQLVASNYTGNSGSTLSPENKLLKELQENITILQHQGLKAA